MKQSKFYPAIVLSSICIVVALLLSVVNMFTAPVIEANQNASANQALLDVLPGGKDFKELEITEDYPASVTKGWSAEGGYVFQMEVKGYAAGLVIMCGVDSEGKIAGVKHISSNETFGAETQLNIDYTAKADTLDTLEQLPSSSASGAPETTRAYHEAVKAALQSAILAGGGDVDTRTPEQILQDNCNLAIGTEKKAFERWFATEILVGVKNVYVSDSGVAMLVGDKFIGVDSTGAIVNSVAADGTVEAPSADEAAIVETAYALYSSTSLTEVEVPTGASKRVKKIEITATGNYVMHMEAAGNGINGEEWSHPSGEYIKFMVSISPDGKIIDVKTTYQSESDGWGAYCETDEYTEQFKGAIAGDIVITPEHTSKDSTDLGIISGSTITSNGYQRALKQAFVAFELLTVTEEGGNE